MKQFTIKETRYSFSGVREKEITGTLEELTEYFRYTLECGRRVFMAQRLDLRQEADLSLLQSHVLLFATP